MSTTPPTERKALYGAVAMLLAFILQQFHVKAAAEELEAVIGQLVDVIQVLLGIGGFIMAIWGRRKTATAEDADD